MATRACKWQSGAPTCVAPALVLHPLCNLPFRLGGMVAAAWSQAGLAETPGDQWKREGGRQRAKLACGRRLGGAGAAGWAWAAVHLEGQEP